MKTAHRKFLSLFSALFLPMLVYIVGNYSSNADVRGWWPVALVFWLASSLVLSLVFLLIEKVRPMPLAYTYVVSVAVFSVMLWMMGWRDVDDGVLYSVLGTFLLVHFVVVFWSRYNLNKSIKV